MVPVKAKVPTANRKHLFFSKAARATKESRPEDFMDLTFIIRTAGGRLQDIMDYCAAPDRREIVMRGLEILISGRTKFTRQVFDRLTYEEIAKPVDEWVEDAAKDLDEFRTAIGKKSYRFRNRFQNEVVAY